MRRAVLLAIVLASLTGCQSRGPVATPPPTAGPTEQPRADLTAYVGHYPSDVAGRTSFLADPLVAAAVRSTGVPAPVAAFVLAGEGPQTPIAAKAGRIAAWGCEAHNCGDHNWTLLIAADATAPELCVVDVDGTGAATPRWYAKGGREDRTDACPGAD